jgi:hypothetical protein
MAEDQALITAIILARLALPLAIPRFPLTILAALVLDAVDGTILEQFSSVDTGPGGPYQSFDKALDIYYLAIAYLATMRNWTSVAAVRVARFLFYYRLVGVLAFETFDSRAMLLLFPNTFEFYFIAYEALRTRYDPDHWSARFWVLVAGGLWVFVKLPQEYWIHVAQLDFTDAVADHPWFGVLCGVGIVALLLVAVFVVRPRMPAPWPWRFAAAAPPAVTSAPGWREFLEKVCLLALISVIFGEILPSVRFSAVDVALGAVALVAVNTWIVRRHPALGFVARLGLNLALIYFGARVLSDRGNFPFATALFFAYLTTLIVVLYDAYRPVFSRRAEPTSSPGTAPRPRPPMLPRR